MRNFKYLLMIISLLSFLGCVTAQYSSFVTTTFPSKQPNEVKVYQTSLPDKPYEEIGMIEAEGSQSHSIASLIKSLRKKAAENGADAIILQQASEKLSGILPIGGMIVPVHRKIYRATAIRFK